MKIFKVDDKVRIKIPVLRRRGDKLSRDSARILVFYRDVKGGVGLSRPIHGFVSWNVTDLVKVK